MLPDVLVAAEADWVFEEVQAALAEKGNRVLRVRDGAQVLPALEAFSPGLVVADLQMGTMGGIAACLDIKLEEGAGRLGHIPVLLLLDRQADVFLAQRSGAEGWLVKPLDAFRLRRAAAALAAGGRWEEPTGLETVPVEPAPRWPAEPPSGSRGAASGGLAGAPGAGRCPN